MRPESARPLHLPEAFQLGLVALFGALCLLLIHFFDRPGVHRLELLALASSGAAVLTSLVWLFALAAYQRSAFAILLVLPYVNLIAASYYARRHWRNGARAPALLGIAGFLLQIVASLGALFAESARLV